MYQRLKLIKNILVYKRNQLAAGANASSSNTKKGGDEEGNKDGDKDGNASLSPEHDNNSDSDFNPDDFINTDNDPVDSDDEPLQKKKKPDKSKRSSASVGDANPGSSSESSLEFEPNSKSKESETPSTSKPNVPNRLKRILAANTFKEFDLFKYLETSVTTRVVLVDREKGFLTDSRRKLLLSVLASYMINESPEITVENFQDVTAKIIKLWPKENPQLYYTAPKETGPHQATARGKLFNAVRNKVGKLIKENAREPRRKRKSKGLSEATNSELSQVREPTPDVQASLTQVKRARELSAEVEVEWKKSSEHRLDILYSEARKSRKNKRSKKSRNENTAPVTISEYLDEYKILKTPKGFSLLLIDYKVLHKESSDLFVVWETLQPKLELLARDLIINDKDGKELASLLKPTDEENLDNSSHEELDENDKDAVLLQLLPSLCPPTARVTLGKSTFKPSVIESRNAFIAFTTVGADVEPLMERQRERLIQKGAPLQPYIILQGQKRSNIAASYVALDRVLYKIDGVLKCVDVCFKLFHALCLGYPPEANHLWHIFHLYVYKIKHETVLDGDIQLSTSAFITALENM
ncbi:Meiotically up-regulated gene 154 protein [Frankliniella fusca]|uniref:Meiotically up-regulated gene 154 protein n=1 Tax=Frankliniella fusca TaxID=407009 RepID=A0AAE1LE93_9NEOP|nr:Meiotically up-regulated gene 154 protein [Frankliniella fusca]